MKRSNFIIFASALLFSSCGTWGDQMGYPRKVTIPKEGGVFIITGDSPIYSFDLSDRDYDMSVHSNGSFEDDTISVTLQWLTVKRPQLSPKIIMIAEPSPHKKSRELFLRGYTGPKLTDITIKQ